MTMFLTAEIYEFNNKTLFLFNLIITIKVPKKMFFFFFK